MSKVIVAPSIHAADFGNLAKEISEIESLGADWLHIDIMDGSFVPTISFGERMVQVAKESSKLYSDVHLMIVNPEQHIKDFAEAGADNITVHVEACQNTRSTLEEIKSYGVDCGLSIKPETSAEVVFEYLEICDLVLVMTVNPGWSGQKFLSECLEKVKIISDEASKKGLNINMQVDGGVNAETGKLCYQNGANVLVAGSYIFGAKDRQTRIQSLRYDS